MSPGIRRGPAPVQREILTDKELCLLHSEFFQLSADLPVEIGSASKDERASGAFQFGRKICLLTMHAEEFYMIPRAPDLCEKYPTDEIPGMIVTSYDPRFSRTVESFSAAL